MKNKEIKELGANGGGVDDSEAYDIAGIILSDEEGLEAGIKKHFGVTDPQGWLADRV